MGYDTYQNYVFVIILLFLQNQGEVVFHTTYVSNYYLPTYVNKINFYLTYSKQLYKIKTCTGECNFSCIHETFHAYINNKHILLLAFHMKAFSQ